MIHVHEKILPTTHMHYISKWKTECLSCVVSTGFILELYEPPAKRSHVSADVKAATRDQRFLSADELNRHPDYHKKRDFLRCLQLEPVPSDARRGISTVH